MLFAIAVSVAILLGFQLLMPHRPATPPHQDVATRTTPASQSPAPTGNPAGPGTQPVPAAVPQNAPRVKIAAPRLEGSLSLLGARIDDLVLRDYRETMDPTSPLVRLLEPRSDPQPYYVQFGWSASDGKIRLPDSNTVVDRLRERARPRPAGDAELGQRRGPHLPDRAGDRRQLHVHRRAAGAERHGRSGLAVSLGAHPARLHAAGDRLLHPPRRPGRRRERPRCRSSPTRRCGARARRSTASPIPARTMAAGRASPTNTG